jgi:hypothetical protein
MDGVIRLAIKPLALIAEPLTEQHLAILPAAKLPPHLKVYAHLG